MSLLAGKIKCFLGSTTPYSTRPFFCFLPSASLYWYVLASRVTNISRAADLFSAAGSIKQAGEYSLIIPYRSDNLRDDGVTLFIGLIQVSACSDKRVSLANPVGRLWTYGLRFCHSSCGGNAKARYQCSASLKSGYHYRDNDWRAFHDHMPFLDPVC